MSLSVESILVQVGPSIEGLVRSGVIENPTGRPHRTDSKQEAFDKIKRTIVDVAKLALPQPGGHSSSTAMHVKMVLGQFRLIRMRRKENALSPCEPITTSGHKPLGHNGCWRRTPPRLDLRGAPPVARSDVRHARCYCNSGTTALSASVPGAGTEPREEKGIRQTVTHTPLLSGPQVR
ncbi:hypothetical protein Efla_005220 [Eimeria flavescens]